jgi:hypothetical protein
MRCFAGSFGQVWDLEQGADHFGAPAKLCPNARLGHHGHWWDYGYLPRPFLFCRLTPQRTSILTPRRSTRSTIPTMRSLPPRRNFQVCSPTSRTSDICSKPCRPSQYGQHVLAHPAAHRRSAAIRNLFNGKHGSVTRPAQPANKLGDLSIVFAQLVDKFCLLFLAVLPITKPGGLQRYVSH